MTHTQPARPEPDQQDIQVNTATYLSTVIASVPGIMAQSLRAMVESLPSVRVVGTAAGCLSALQLLRDTQADLVVIDSNLPIEDVYMLLQQMKREGLPARSIVLAATRSHAQKAREAGADIVFRREGSNGQLRALVATMRV
jgi:DNA-binding NarL/FixJ family response regulator